MVCLNDLCRISAFCSVGYMYRMPLGFYEMYIEFTFEFWPINVGIQYCDDDDDDDEDDDDADEYDADDGDRRRR